MPPTEEELYKQSRIVQDKFTYFLLAVAASVIGFTIQEVSGRIFEKSLIFLGIAIILWCMSFYFGCLHIKYVSSTIYANYGLIQTQNDKNLSVPDEPEYISAATAGIREAMEKNAEKANKYAKWQFRILILGAIFYIFWQITEMAIRSNVI